MSLIDDRCVCDTCGGYRLGFRSRLSSVCTCPDYHPVELASRSVGALRRPIHVPKVEL